MSHLRFAGALNSRRLQRPAVLLAALGLMTQAVLGQVASDTNLVAPASPSTLLAMLPQPPEHWTLTTSIGVERPSSDLVLETYCMREYLFVPPPPSQPPATPAPKLTVRVALIDAGNNPARFGSFAGFAPDAPNAAPAGLHKKLVEGLPAIEIKRDAMDELTIEISPRILLAVHSVNVDDDTRDRWIQQLGISKIVAACQTLPAVRLATTTYTLESVDELHPARNGKTSFGYVTKADMARARAQH